MYNIKNRYEYNEQIDINIVNRYEYSQYGIELFQNKRKKDKKGGERGKETKINRETYRQKYKRNESVREKERG